MSNISKNEMENELETKMAKMSLLVNNPYKMQCVSVVIDFVGLPTHIKKHWLYNAESFNCNDYHVRQAVTKHATTNTVWQTSAMNFANFSTIKKIMLKTFRKTLNLLQLLSVCHYSLQTSDEVAPFINVSVIQKILLSLSWKLESTPSIS